MAEGESEVGAAVAPDEKSPEDIRREIDDARQELGDTAAALAAKTDVKARAKEKVEGVKQTIAAKTEALGSGSSSSSGADAGGPQAQANAALAQVKSKAQTNPIPAAAIAAFVGGFVFGRISSRR